MTKELYLEEHANDLEEMTQEERLNTIKEYIEGLWSSDLIRLWNDICDYERNPDDRIYYMEDWEDIFGSTDTWDIACMIYNAPNFSPWDEYFEFDGYGNINTFSDVTDTIDIDYIVSYIDKECDDLEDLEMMF